MMSARNRTTCITRIGPGTPCGTLLRRYWQPAALAEELQGQRPVKPVRLLGEDLVLFRDEQGRSACSTATARTAAPTWPSAGCEDGGLRCPFHGWLFDVTGQCLETPAEPEGSRSARNIRQRGLSGGRAQRHRCSPTWARASRRRSPSFDCFVAPDATPSPSRACGSATGCRRWRSASTRRTPRSCTASSRTRTARKAYGRQFRDASTDSDMPMTQVLREFDRPHDRGRADRLRPAAHHAARASATRKTHVRVTNLIFPHAFVIPMSHGDDDHAVARAGR